MYINKLKNRLINNPKLEIYDSEFIKIFDLKNYSEFRLDMTYITNDINNSMYITELFNNKFKLNC